MKNTGKIFLSMGMIVLLTQACSLTQLTQTGNTSGQTPTAIFATTEQNQNSQSATQTAEFANWPTQTPESTSTPIPTQVPTSTNTSTPVSVSPAGAKQITFLPGGTSAYEQQQITSAQEISYVVTAEKDQTLIISVSSSNNDVYLDIKGIKTGQTIVSASQRYTEWTGILPATQNYLITLSTTSPATDYFLSVEIPVNILFTQGKDSIAINGYIDVHKTLYPSLITRVSYLAYASAGQTMTINITSPYLNSLSLGIFGQADGQPYKRYEVSGTSATMKLPATQGYYIKVYSTGGLSTDYTLDVTIQ